MSSESGCASCAGAAACDKPAAKSSEFEPKIVAFLCNWCSYTGADLTGTSRLQYPPNIRIVRVMCSSRISPLLIMKTLEMGADGVLVSGCHPGDCHYLEGNYYLRRRAAVFKEFLKFMGIEDDRVTFSWVSASEGVKFADLVKDVTAKVKALGPQRTINSFPEGW